jgi:diguanylate cyclase (GGDEF)-like protein
MISPCHADETLFHSTTLDNNSGAHVRAYRRPALGCTPGGVSDRIVFTEKLREELERRSRSFPNFSLLFGQICSVTLCNDTDGFPTENHIVDTVAAKLRRGLRTADGLIRSGEYGFVVFLSKASPAGANAVATRLTAAIDNTNFFSESVAFQVKIGVTVASIQTEDTVETILARTDRFLLEQQKVGSFLRGHPLQPKEIEE